MSRPRKDSACPDMRVALIDAFWELLQSQRLETISVRALTSATSCNRATFYYHFADIDDLIYQALSRDLVEDPTLPAALSSFIAGIEGSQITELFGNPQFAHLQLLFANGGLERAVHTLSRLVEQSWQRMLYPQGGELSSATKLVLNYAVGGMTSLLMVVLQDADSTCVDPAGAMLVRAFLKDNSAHMLHQISLSEGIPVAEITTLLRQAVGTE